jgi:cellulose synthase/poly-beta-1,6-N-acetylglucosamine synthase-like glycosyltransferase
MTADPIHGSSVVYPQNGRSRLSSETLPPSSVLSVSVVISAYTEERWTDLLDAVRSVGAQSYGDLETIVVIDHNPALLARARRELPQATVIPNDLSRGLSGARNSGIAVGRGDVVVFLDDDARAQPGWLDRLLAPYEDDAVIAVGGRIDADWRVPRPRWFPVEFDWVVGCSYRGMPVARAKVRNVIGANMSFRREAFEHVGGFPVGLGRVGTLPAGCEETEMCIRVADRLPGRSIVYEPAAAVAHTVTPTRASVRYFLSRCVAEGRSKALVTAVAGARVGLETERRYVARVLPAGIVRGVGEAVRGDATGIARAAAIAAGATLTTAGYVAGVVSARSRPRRSRP